MTDRSHNFLLNSKSDAEKFEIAKKIVEEMKEYIYEPITINKNGDDSSWFQEGKHKVEYDDYDSVIILPSGKPVYAGTYVMSPHSDFIEMLGSFVKAAAESYTENEYNSGFVVLARLFNSRAIAAIVDDMEFLMVDVAYWFNALPEIRPQTTLLITDKSVQNIPIIQDAKRVERIFQILADRGLIISWLRK